MCKLNALVLCLLLIGPIGKGEEGGRALNQKPVDRLAGDIDLAWTKAVPARGEQDMDDGANVELDHHRASLSVDSVLEDYRVHYSRDKLVELALWVGAAGILATSDADREVYEWNSRIKTTRWDKTFKTFEDLGEYSHGIISLPVYAGTYFLGKWMEGTAIGHGLERWGAWSFRAMLVGGPQALVLMEALGAERPEEGDSKWDPFKDNNGVSGHAFTGAVPLLVLGRMTPSKPLRYLLYAVSMMPAAARVHRNKHYLSQVVLGWGLAYMAVDSVARADEGRGPNKMVWTPYFEGERVGISFSMRF